MSGNDRLKCSFCGKTQDQVKKLIAGPDVFICDECVELCNEILDEEFFEGKERTYCYETLENLAFFRLNKIAQQYDLAKNFIKNDEQLSQIQNKAKEYKKDLDIIQSLSF